MTKYKEIYGVDISKDVFDVFGSLAGHCQFKNTDSGFHAFAKASDLVNRHFCHTYL